MKGRRKREESVISNVKGNIANNSINKLAGATLMMRVILHEDVLVT